MYQTGDVAVILTWVVCVCVIGLTSENSVLLKVSSYLPTVRLIVYPTLFNFFQYMLETSVYILSLLLLFIEVHLRQPLSLYPV